MPVRGYHLVQGSSGGFSKPEKAHPGRYRRRTSAGRNTLDRNCSGTEVACMRAQPQTEEPGACWSRGQSAAGSWVVGAAEGERRAFKVACALACGPWLGLEGPRCPGNAQCPRGEWGGGYGADLRVRLLSILTLASLPIRLWSWTSHLSSP